MSAPARKRVAVMLSGRGSNMEALIAACAARDFPAEIVAVVSNRADARGIETAKARGIETAVIPFAGHASREAHDAAVGDALKRVGAELVCLAGYMRILTPGFVAEWSGRMINIHPSLLPAFPGLHTHRRALEEGVRVTGCTVHFVTEIMDKGPIVAQAVVPVLDGDDEDRLSARVLKAEHRLYPHALKMVASGAARMQDGRVVVSGHFPDSAGDMLVSPPEGTAAIDHEALARMTP